MRLTEHQRQEFENLLPWIRGEGGHFAKLKGSAGVGKTFTVNKLLQEVKKLTVTYKDPESKLMVSGAPRICVTAPTHQAKKVIQKATEQVARTIQSLLGLAPNTDIDNFDINKPEFAIKNTPGMHKFDYIVIDEASMLNTMLKNMIVEMAKEHGVKLLFIYDEAQLAPVGERKIPIEEMSTPFFGHLKEVIRTGSDNPLMEFLIDIRNNITSGKDAFSHVSKFDNKGGMVFFRDRKEFEKRAVMRAYTTYRNGKPGEDKILAYTNKRVSELNLIVRSSIKLAEKLNDPIHNFFIPNEPIVSLKTIKDSIIVTSEEFVVENPEIGEEMFEYYLRDKETKVANFVDVQYAHIKVINADIKVLGGNSKERVRFILPEVENYKEFLKVFTWYHSLGKVDRNWDSFTDWKSGLFLIRELQDAKGKTVCSKDFDYAYATTIHKSQGSTYTNIYLDEADVDQIEDMRFCRFLYDIEKKKAAKQLLTLVEFEKNYPTFTDYYNFMQETKNRLKYVAMSRAKSFVVVNTRK